MSYYADRLDAQVDTQVQETSGLHADIYTAWHENRFQDLEAVTVDEQAKSTETVVSMVSDVAAIADETTREAEGTAATAQEQTASMSRVPASVSSLAEQATQLSNALDRFDTGRGAGTGGPTREAMTDDTEREAETDDTAQE